MFLILVNTCGLLSLCLKSRFVFQFSGADSSVKIKYTFYRLLTALRIMNYVFNLYSTCAVMDWFGFSIHHEYNKGGGARQVRSPMATVS